MAKRRPRRIQIYDKVLWNGEEWTVSFFSGLTAQLRSTTSAEVWAVALETLFTSPDFEVSSTSTQDDEFGERAPHPFDEMPAAALEQAQSREADLVALFGDPLSPDARPPDPRYQGMSIDERAALLAARHNRDPRTAYRWLKRYGSMGLAGLADLRYLNLSGGYGWLPRDVVKYIEQVQDATLDESRLTNVEKRNRVIALINAAADTKTKVPSQRTFDRMLSKIVAGRGTHLSQKRQREATKPLTKVAPPFSLTRPMELVMVDETPLDMFALDPLAGNGESTWQRVHLTLAVDVFSRSIVGWVFTSGPPSNEDISTLLYRIASPKITDPSWPEHARWRYPGAPEWLIFEDVHEVQIAAPVAGVPFGQVETFVVDHGKVFISRTIRENARLLRCHLLMARLRTPQDKPQIEAAFDRVREQFVMRLPGYKGSDIFSRGSVEKVEGAAFLFLWEIDHYFAKWVACDYQNTVHEGLQWQSCPNLELTPNDAYDHGITRSGLLPVPPPRDLLVELLPTDWRTVQSYGIEKASVRYQDNALNPYRSRKSMWGGMKGKWKLKADKHDRSHIWFWAADLEHNDSTNGAWEYIPYRGWQEAPVFGDEEIAYAKAIILGRGGDLRNRDQFESVLDGVLRRASDTDSVLPREERRMMGRTWLRALFSRESQLGTASGTEPQARGPHAQAPLPLLESVPATSDTSEPMEAGPPPASPGVAGDSEVWEPVVLTTPDEIEVDYFAELDLAVDRDLLAGMEDLSREDEEE